MLNTTVSEEFEDGFLPNVVSSRLQVGTISSSFSELARRKVSFFSNIQTLLNISRERSVPHKQGQEKDREDKQSFHKGIIARAEFTTRDVRWFSATA